MPNTLCPFCGAHSPKQCELEEETGGACPWEDSERIMKHAEIAHGFHLFRDGNMWCAVGPHFINLAESDAGFGPDHAAAVAELHKYFERDPWWKNKTLPGVERFTVHN